MSVVTVRTPGGPYIYVCIAESAQPQTQYANFDSSHENWKGSLSMFEPKRMKVETG